MTFTEYLEHRLQMAELLRSKHVDHFDEGINRETWGYFSGYINAMKEILNEVQKYDIRRPEESK